MTSRDFCFWLQGFFEIAGDNTTLGLKQTEMVKRHLALVFKHEIDPSLGGNAAELQLIHDGINKPSLPIPTGPTYCHPAEIVRC